MGINGNNQVCRHKQGSNLGKEQHILPIKDTFVPIGRKRMDLLWTIYSLQLSHLKRTVNLVESGGIRSCSLG